MNKKEIIGYSDYTRAEIRDQIIRGETIYSLGDSVQSFLSKISQSEKKGYTVKFETSIIRRLFKLALYKVVAYPKKGDK